MTDIDRQIDEKVAEADSVIVSSDSCYRELPLLVIFNNSVPEVIRCELWKSYQDAKNYVQTVRGQVPQVDNQLLANIQ